MVMVMMMVRRGRGEAAARGCEPAERLGMAPAHP
jgi:hypothetical protein